MAAWLVVALLAVLTAGLVAHLVAAARFRRRTDALIRALAATPAAGGTAPAPPPRVVAYARRAVPEGALPALIRLRQRAEMRLRPGASWRPLTAEQAMSVRTPGFVWRARVSLAPLIFVEVVDAYVAGTGLLEVRLFGSVPLARASGPAIDRGEVMRYLAELAWVPEAMLHNPGLRWRALGPDAVEVAAESPAGPARVRLIFEHDDLVRIEADDRPRDEGGKAVPRPWSGRFSDYREIGGHRIPTRGEVSWLLDDGPFAYWRGEVIALEADPAPAVA